MATPAFDLGDIPAFPPPTIPEQEQIQEAIGLGNTAAVTFGTLNTGGGAAIGGALSVAGTAVFNGSFAGNGNTNTLPLQNLAGQYNIVTRQLGDARYLQIAATVVDNAGTSIALVAADSGKTIRCTAATAVTVTMPASDPVGFNVMVIQGGVGQITFVAGGGNTLQSYGALVKTAGQYASASILRVAAATYNIGGALT